MYKYSLYVFIFLFFSYYQTYFLQLFTNNINSFLLNEFIYFLFASIFYILDYYKHPSTQIYKVHTINTSDNIIIFPTIIKNHIISLFVFIFYSQYTTKGLSLSYTPTYLIFFQSILFMCLFDIIFYTGHRLIHTSLLYKYIHKKHHTINANIAISGYYMDTIDFFIKFMFPVYISTYLLNANILVLFICSVIGQINGLISHSAYNFPFLPYEKDHLLHHLKLHCNYGILFMDYLFNTHK